MTEAQYERIDRYLCGTLDERERVLFEQDVARDSELAGALALAEESRLLLLSSEKDRIRTMVSKKAQRAQRRRLPWYAAATFLLLTGCWFALRFNYASSQLLAENFSVYPDRVTTYTSDYDRLTEGMEAYRNEDFEQAAALFSAPELQTNESAQLYAAVSALALSNAQEAIGRLEPLESTPGNYTEVARWYLSLAYLMDGQEEATIILLKEIVANGENSYHYQEAKELLSDLESIFH